MHHLARFFDHACAAAEFRYGGRQLVPLWPARPTQFPLLGKAGTQERDLACARRARSRLVRILGLRVSQHFCHDQNITMHHLGVLYSTNAWDPITEEIVLQALHLLVQPSTYPCLVMCNLGRHRTGTVIGCLRKLQHWNLSAILEEYRRFAGPKVRVMNEQFIELFDEELVFGENQA